MDPKGTQTTLANLIQCQLLASRLNYNLKKSAGIQSGDKLTFRKGRGMDFREVRAYQAGDDSRSMDWRVTARYQTPHIKLYEEEREHVWYFILDLSDSLFFGTKNSFKSVLLSHIAATLIWLAHSKKDKVGVLIFNGENTEFIPAQSQKFSILKILKYISEYTQNKSKQNNKINLKPLLTIKNKSKIILLSDFIYLDNQDFKILNQLSQKHSVTSSLIYDNLEAVAPMDNIYKISNGIDFFEINTHDKNFKLNYENNFESHINKIKNKLNFNINLINTHFALSRQLDKLFIHYA